MSIWNVHLQGHKEKDWELPAALWSVEVNTAEIIHSLHLRGELLVDLNPLFEYNHWSEAEIISYQPNFNVKD